MEILKFPHSSLLKPCKPVTVFGPELKTILDSMFRTMVGASGIGLAANQVGLDMRAFVMITAQGYRLNVINPKILESSKGISDFKEGCLSAPGELLITGNRAIWIHVEFQDEIGIVRKMIFADLQSVCFQHELEHLEGKAFIQSKSIPKSKRMSICKRWGLKGK